MTHPRPDPARARAYGAAPTFDKLRRWIAPVTIARALAAAGVATRRRARLPLDRVIWLPIAMALFAHDALDTLVARLRLARPGATGKPVGSGAICQARARLGADAVRHLFRMTARRWSDRLARVPTARWCGLALFGVDGTTLAVADTPALRAQCGGRAGGRGKPAGYPQLRRVALLALGTRVVRDAAWGSLRQSEHALLAQLWPRVPPRSLTVFDRGFYSTWLFAAWPRGCATRHWLCRAKRGAGWRRVRRLGARDWLVRLAVSARARRRDATLPSHVAARAVWVQARGFRGTWLLTSLTDADAYPRAALAAVYRQRWGHEVAWDELKTHLLVARRPLRSRTPCGLRQEVWGALLAYNLVRREAAALAAVAAVAPTAISFVGAVRHVQDAWLQRATTAAAARTHGDRTAAALDLLVLPPPRTHRRYPRAVKVRGTRFPRKPPARHARRPPDLALQKSWVEAA